MCTVCNIYRNQSELYRIAIEIMAERSASDCTSCRQVSSSALQRFIAKQASRLSSANFAPLILQFQIRLPRARRQISPCFVGRTWRSQLYSTAESSQFISLFWSLWPAAQATCRSSVAGQVWEVHLRRSPQNSETLPGRLKRCEVLRCCESGTSLHQATAIRMKSSVTVSAFAMCFKLNSCPVSCRVVMGGVGRLQSLLKDYPEIMKSPPSNKGIHEAFQIWLFNAKQCGTCRSVEHLSGNWAPKMSSACVNVESKQPEYLICYWHTSYSQVLPNFRWAFWVAF